MSEQDAKTSDGVIFAAGGERKNKGKIRFDLIPPEVDLALAEVLTKGAEKYADRNWEKGMPFVEGMLASLKRHINAWEMGEDTDSESGLSHMAHVLTNAAFIVTLERRADPWRFDDRVHSQLTEMHVEGTLDGRVPSHCHMGTMQEIKAAMVTCTRCKRVEGA